MTLAEYIKEQRTDEGLVTTVLITSAAIFFLIMVLIVESMKGGSFDDERFDDNDTWMDFVRRNGLIHGTISYIRVNIDEFRNMIHEQKYMVIVHDMEQDPRIKEYAELPKRKKTLKLLKELTTEYAEKYKNYPIDRIWRELKEYDKTAVNVEKEVEQELA